MTPERAKAILDERKNNPQAYEADALQYLEECIPFLEASCAAAKVNPQVEIVEFKSQVKRKEVQMAKYPTPKKSKPTSKKSAKKVKKTTRRKGR